MNRNSRLKRIARLETQRAEHMHKMTEADRHILWHTKQRSKHLSEWERINEELAFHTSALVMQGE